MQQYTSGSACDPRFGDTACGVRRQLLLQRLTLHRLMDKTCQTSNVLFHAWDFHTILILSRKKKSSYSNAVQYLLPQVFLIIHKIKREAQEGSKIHTGTKKAGVRLDADSFNCLAKGFAFSNMAQQVSALLERSENEFAVVPVRVAATFLFSPCA